MWELHHGNAIDGWPFNGLDRSVVHVGFQGMTGSGKHRFFGIGLELVEIMHEVVG